MQTTTHIRVAAQVVLVAVVGLVAIYSGTYLVMTTLQSLFGGAPGMFIGRISGLAIAAWGGFCTYLYGELYREALKKGGR